jgi:hypothetical protein
MVDLSDIGLCTGEKQPELSATGVTSLTHVNDRSPCWFGTGNSIKSDGVKLVQIYLRMIENDLCVRTILNST